MTTWDLLDLFMLLDGGTMCPAEPALSPVALGIACAVAP